MEGAPILALTLKKGAFTKNTHELHTQTGMKLIECSSPPLKNKYTSRKSRLQNTLRRLFSVSVVDPEGFELSEPLAVVVLRVFLQAIAAIFYTICPYFVSEKFYLILAFMSGA